MKFTHQQISWLKSAIRIIGYMALPVDLIIGMVLLVVSEAVGIWEEVGY